VTGTDTSGNNAATALGTCVMNCCNMPGGSGGSPSDIYAFHTAGANIAYCDGSVHFVSNAIDLVTLASMVTKGGGEVFNSSY